MGKYIILSEKYWHLDLFNNLKNTFNEDDWVLINNKTDFTFEKLKEINPNKKDNKFSFVDDLLKPKNK
jgi:methionyl-tRNA formyltransferase